MCCFFHSHLPSKMQLLWPHFHALPNGNISISLLTLKSCIIYSTQRVQQCKVPSTNSLSAHTPSQGSAQTTCSNLRYHHKEIRSEIPVQSPCNKQVGQGRNSRQNAGRKQKNFYHPSGNQVKSDLTEKHQHWLSSRRSSLLSSIHTTVSVCMFVQLRLEF